MDNRLQSLACAKIAGANRGSGFCVGSHGVPESNMRQ